jgi:hypothetical protein
MSICLIIAFYFGARCSNTVTEESFFKLQKIFLNKTKHNLSKIVFAIAQDYNNTPTPLVIDNVQDKDNTDQPNITYFYRKNNGLSFGSWIDVVNYYQFKYDYYIFCEDDYIFVKDHFDTILKTEYDLSDKDYIVNWMEYKSDGKFCRSSLISTIGISSTLTLQKITNNFSPIKWYNNKGRDFAKFLELFNSIDSVNKYDAFPYWESNNVPSFIRLYGCIKNESKSDYYNRVLVCAIQMINPDTHTIIEHDIESLPNDIELRIKPIINTNKQIKNLKHAVLNQKRDVLNRKQDILTQKIRNNKKNSHFKQNLSHLDNITQPPQQGKELVVSDSKIIVPSQNTRRKNKHWRHTIRRHVNKL